jgi:hypothetical protein
VATHRPSVPRPIHEEECDARERARDRTPPRRAAAHDEPPEKRNALNNELRGAILAALQEADADPT